MTNSNQTLAKFALPDPANLVNRLGIPRLLGALLLISMTTTAAVAQEKIDETVTTTSSPTVTIQHVNGKANIVTWDEEKVNVKGRLGANTESFDIDANDGAVTVKIEVKRNKDDNYKNYSKDDGDDLTIYLPRQSRLFYTSMNADVTATGIRNHVDIDVVNGDISLQDIRGKMKVETVNGDIEFSNIAGEVEMETVNGDIKGTHDDKQDVEFDTVNGDIEVTTNAQEVSVESVNGRIELALGEIRELEIETVNGKVSASMQLLNIGDVSVTSVGGNIDLVLQEEVSARFKINAHAGGRIVNEITDAEVQKAKYGPGRWLEFMTAGGAAEVEVSTVSGKVTLEVEERVSF